MVKLIALSRIALAAALLSVVALPASAAVLYDGSVALKPLPTDQGWTYLTNPLTGASSTQNAVGGGVRLDSTAAVGEKAGYFNFTHPGMEPMDRAAGYTVAFDVKINSESHNNNDRAGFSVIAISSDWMGIELGFWADTIFAQAAGFAHAEDVAFSSASMTRYELAVTGDTYALRAAGATTPILTGLLRDYRPAVVPVPDVYEIPNFLFLGDDTGSAGASVDMTYIELTPEPATLSILAVSALALLRRRRGCPRT